MNTLRRAACFLIVVPVAFGCGPNSEVQQPAKPKATEQAAPAAAQPISIKLSQHAVPRNRDGFAVTGLTEAELRALDTIRWTPDEWNKLLVVRVAGEKRGDKERPPVLGSVRVLGDLLWFEPRFPLEPGVRYRVVFDPKALPGRADDKRQPVVAELSLPKPAAAATTVVERVYPTANVLPENQLKFYLHFSAPMGRGEAYSRVHLLDAAGKEIELPFLELDQELWDPQGTRFTLFFDPGRIKRGLKPREEVGPALEEGKSYTLVIDRDWNDAKGNRLKEPYRKSFRVGPPEERQVDFKTWKVEPPAAGDAKPLTVTFPRPMEHALMERMIRLQDAKGQAVEGRVETSAEETKWHFTPAKPWPAGEYRLTVDTAIEDLAGNSIAKPFEVDVFRKVQHRVETETVELPFRVGPAR